MQEYGMTLSDAMQHVRRQRYFINPNDGFRRQLQAFQRELNLKRAQEGGAFEKHPEEESKVITSIGAAQDNYQLKPGSISTTNVSAVKNNYVVAQALTGIANPLFAQKSYT
jgi:hypothetical protein